MKKNNCLSLLTFLLFASAFAFSACSSDDNDESSSKPGSSSDTPKVTSVTKDVSTFGATTNLQLENYDYKVDFVLPISVGEQWTAEIKYDEHDFYTETDDKGQTVDTEEIYQLGGDDSGLKPDVLPPSSKEARAIQSSSAKIVTLYVFQNVVQNTHNATLTIKYGKTGTENTKVINLEQKAGAENAEANESVAMKQFIGYGYNSRRGYASTLCRRNAIFKVTELMSDGIPIMVTPLRLSTRMIPLALLTLRHLAQTLQNLKPPSSLALKAICRLQISLVKLNPIRNGLIRAMKILSMHGLI